MTRGMQEVGDYLFQEFFNNDPVAYRSLSHTKHVSLRLLADQCETMDLPVRRTFLANALGIAVLARELPKGARYLALPPSHRVELLKVRAPQRVEQLATKALEANLSVVKLRELVRKDKQRNKSPRGRRPTPPPLAALRACVNQLRDPDTGRLVFRKEELAAMSDAEREEAARLIGVLLKRADDLFRLLT